MIRIRSIVALALVGTVAAILLAWGNRNTPEQQAMEGVCSSDAGVLLHR